MMSCGVEVQPHEQAIAEKNPHYAEGNVDQRDLAWHERTGLSW